MPTGDGEFLKRLLTTFRAEADEHLTVLANGLLELERDPGSEERSTIVEMLFREAHSLKGAARAVELTDIESGCQSIESVFAAWRQNELTPTTAQFDTLNELIDALRQAADAGDDSVAAGERLAHLSRRVDGLAETSHPAAQEHAADKADRPEDAASQSGGRTARATTSAGDKDETIRVPLSRLTELMLRAEELVTVKLFLRERAASLTELQDEFAIWRKKWQTARAQNGGFSDRIARDGEDGEGDRRRLEGLNEYLAWSNEFITSLAQRVARLANASDRDLRTLGPLVDEVLGGAKTLVMLPFSSLSQSLPKMVRDLARAEGKGVDLRVSGGDMEIDRHVLETIKDPIIHILRNSVGHGIEPPDIRARLGKPVRGTITIDVGRDEGDKLCISISDDGRGIDTEAVREVATKAGIKSADQSTAFDGDQALALAFESGVSTSPFVTDVSGRGIGLAIVREKVEQLGGHVRVQSEPDVGATFDLIVPATIASSRGVIVYVLERPFVIPSVYVDRVGRVSHADIVAVEGVDTVSLDGHTVPFAFLHDALMVPRTDGYEEADHLPLIVLAVGGERVALAVDRIVGEQDVLTKSLGPQLESVRNVSGATVLESNQVALILSPSELVRSMKQGAFARTSLSEEATDASLEARSILVVEDSITSRTLLKNILEAAGYLVSTAVDGVEALNALLEGRFDLVISDIEMPRMNGFDLCTKVRADKRLEHLPLMFVTSLETPQERERGLDVGANAYIAKASFDQTTLIETVRRLT
jgi:two-component system chemotaxis sensor kinase CheA